MCDICIAPSPACTHVHTMRPPSDNMYLYTCLHTCLCTAIRCGAARCGAVRCGAHIAVQYKRELPILFLEATSMHDMCVQELNAIEDAATQGTAGTQHRCGANLCDAGSRYSTAQHRRYRVSMVQDSAARHLTVQYSTA